VGKIGRDQKSATENIVALINAGRAAGIVGNVKQGKNFRKNIDII
jgi:hypothetical protein